MFPNILPMVLQVVTNPWLRAFIDLECFVLSGMTAKDTIAAEMAFMFMERNSGKSSIGQRGHTFSSWWLWIMVVCKPV